MAKKKAAEIKATDNPGQDAHATKKSQPRAAVPHLELMIDYWGEIASQSIRLIAF